MEQKKNSGTRTSRKRTRSEMETPAQEGFDLKKLSKQHILQCISAIFHLTREQLKEKNNLIEEAEPIFLQVNCIKVPKTPRRRMRILLPHSVITSDDEVALFVCDLQRGRRKDYEPTVEHYRDLLSKHGCTRVNEIIPMNRVKTEFDQFELKRKLIASYDHFLVDGRISGHISHLLGKEFLKRRKLPTSIRIESKDLKHEVDYALRKMSMCIHSHGDTHVVQVGNTAMSEKEVLKNVWATCKHLYKNYPGGWENVRALRLKGARSLSIPIYVTLKDKNTVKVPIIQPRRPKAYRDAEGELSTLRNTRVLVKPSGEVIVTKDAKSTKKTKRKVKTKTLKKKEDRDI
ncbi:hypothetical protein DMN91_009838 [Ooceraea biroi]|uniref:Ribosomal L1 domain-containing protein n=1 Tax=Ooceraea biroi TaxID=2015173 RepID=A0A026WMS1_OOCBI|nr:ribosomal L1 domain-containing protein CG13096 [Ooceraea biroi]EZA56409.1 Ribosomal L1 domain-containing protein [Ooceraea biroi]RLU17602.1 hypothetical protein DMN91_009838 [Ooceraea biroi]